MNEYLVNIEEGLSLRKGLGRLYYLVAEKTKLDDGIFKTNGWCESEYRNKLISGLGTNTFSEKDVKDLFYDYKERWNDSKRRYFETTEEIDVKDFLIEFKEDLPQDIFESIKKCESIDLDTLKLDDSFEIFQKYHFVREQLKVMIEKEIRNHQLTDKDIYLLSQAENRKFEWLGTQVQAVGLIDILVTNNWIASCGSNYEKAKNILSCFSFSSSPTVDSIAGIYKKDTAKTIPFDRIGVNKK
jgi:hypothetical protein